ncbi:MAG: MATE family efflux transporter [Clostridia bacterium]|nr:MATE family efflux transporter [Clostridia bacterium]
MAKREVNMLSGPIAKGLLSISLPIMVMNVGQNLFNIIDLTILKNYDVGTAVGSVGACGTLIGLVTGLLIGIATGANIVIAKYIGKGDQEAVERSVGTAMLFSVLGGLFLTVIGLLFARVFLSWMKCPESLLDGAVLYFRLYFVGVPILMIYNFAAAILRSTGDSRRPMIFLTLGGFLKVVLTFVFVYFFHAGVTGVALATIFSWALSAFLAVHALLKSGGAVQLFPKHLRIYSHELREILAVGVPAGLQQSLYSIANVVINTTVNTFGAAATTGLSIANNFDGILYQIVMAPSYAVVAYVSQNIGAGNLKRARQAISRGILITTAMGTFFGFLSAFFSRELSSIMTSDPAAIEFSYQKMIVISTTYWICGLNETLGASLRGMGRSLLATVTTMVYMCGFRFFWIYLIFPFMPTQNLTSLYLVWPVGWTLSLFTLLIFYYPTLKTLAQKLKTPATV